MPDGNSANMERKEVKWNGDNPRLFRTHGGSASHRVLNLSTVSGEPVSFESARADKAAPVESAYHDAAALNRAAAFLRGVSHPPDCPLVDLRGIALGGGQALCY